MSPPSAKIVPHILNNHDHARTDNYYWLRDDKRENAEVLRYLEAENAYTAHELKHLTALQGALFEEIVGRIKKDDSTVPYELDGYWYYTRFEPAQEYPIYCRKKGSLESEEEVMLDANAQARGHEYYQAMGLRVSPDAKRLAYAEDKLGRRIYTLRFRNLEDGRDFPESIEGTSGEVAWALDQQTVFYVRRDPTTLRAYQVRRHVLGSDVQADEVVYEEADSEFYVTVRATKSKQYIVIGSYQTVSHEMRVLAADHPNGSFRVFLPRERDHEYDIEHANDRFYVRTNWEAKDFRLMSVRPSESADKSTWREEIPARPGVFLRNFEVFSDYLVVSERREGLTRLRTIPWKEPTKAREVTFEEPAFVVDLGTNPQLETSTLRFVYSSLTTPRSIYDLNMSNHERDLKKQDEVLGGFDPKDYVTDRIVAHAQDGTAVPISLVHHRSLDRSRPQPLLLYAYGSYGLSMDPNFGSARLSLLNRGVIFAIAHVRGGQEFGRSWYENGKLLHKKNTFTDFIDCTKHLIDTGYTSRDRVFGMGGSAGGLLIGAVANMRPELYAGLVAEVPFVDVLTTMLDESIPLTTFEYDEWGNPNDRTFYDYMLSYSPYDNVEAKPYPNLLVMSGLHDSQVQYWEPTKWVAKLRALKTDPNRLLLHTNMDAGHSGASGRFRRHRETAMIYSFILDLLGARK